MYGSVFVYWTFPLKRYSQNSTVNNRCVSTNITAKKRYEVAHKKKRNKTANKYFTGTIRQSFEDGRYIIKRKRLTHKLVQK